MRAPAGVIHAEAADPSIAVVTMPSPEVVVVQGVRSADTALLFVTAATVVAQPLRVSPPLASSGASLAGAAPIGFVDLTYLPGTQAVSVELHRPDLDAVASPGGWQMHVVSGTVTVTGASALATSLQAFGIGGSWGASLRTADGWEVVASGTQSQLAHHWPLGGRDEVVLAGSVAGPLATLHLERGARGMDVAALYQNGTIQAAGTVTTTVGPVLVAYTSGPLGGGLYAQFVQDRWTLSAAQGSQGLQVGISTTVGGDHPMNVWWSAQGGYGLGMTLPLGDFSPLSLSVNSGGLSAAARTADVPGIAGTTTTWFGAGHLTLTGPSSSVPANAASDAATALRQWSPPPLATGVPIPTTPDLVHSRIEIPAGPAAAVRTFPTVVASAPVPIPSGSAALIVHTCLHSASPKIVCDPADPVVVVRLYVDDRPVELMGVALPIAPGQHAVSIYPEDLPPFLVPLGPLVCPTDLVAGAIGVCDFAFRRAGNP